MPDLCVFDAPASGSPPIEVPVAEKRKDSGVLPAAVEKTQKEADELKTVIAMQEREMEWWRARPAFRRKEAIGEEGKGIGWRRAVAAAEEECDRNSEKRRKEAEKEEQEAEEERRKKGKTSIMRKEGGRGSGGGSGEVAKGPTTQEKWR